MKGLPENPRALWLGAPDGDDAQRSPDEVRIINEMTAQEVEAFLAANAVDMGAANQLRREPTHIALAVIERGPLRACRDPSGVIVARIRDAKAGKLGPDPTRTGAGQATPAPPMPPPQPVDPNASDVDKFLLYNRIDQAGVIALKSEPLEVQRAVMAKGTLLNSTNPSASLVARIRLCKEPGQTQGAPPPFVPGLMPPPPPAGIPPLVLDGVPPPPPAPLALEDSAVSQEALKAIQKLEQAGVGQPVRNSPQELPGLDGEPPEKRQKTNGDAIQNSGDRQLQDEALKAIEGLNYAEL